MFGRSISIIKFQTVSAIVTFSRDKRKREFSQTGFAIKPPFPVRSREAWWALCALLVLNRRCFRPFADANVTDWELVGLPGLEPRTKAL
jgi:hypothetical protein